jgi:heavy metal translocating P-type ATPase
LVVAQSMILSLGVNLEESTPPTTKYAVHAAVLAGTLLVIALLGPALLRAAIAELRQRRLTIEALFLLTMTGAMAASMQSFLSGNGPVYFEVVSVILVVYSLGKVIGARARATAMESTKSWAQSLARCRRSDGEFIEVNQVREGDLIEVYPGEAIAVDGVVRVGIGFVSEKVVSGEPFAVVKRPGDCVLAGCFAEDATFRIEATSSGTARQVDQLLEAVEQARNQPISAQALADRLSAIFVPLLAVVATLTFLFWTYRSGWETGLFNAMSVLLVACPCALGLAMPIILWSTLNRLAERGLVVRDGDLVERLAKVNHIVFDKTGTLTEDRFTLLDIATVGGDVERTRLLGWLSLVQEQSNHPIARPFKGTFSSEGAVVETFRNVPGQGIEATLLSEGNPHQLRIGRPEWIAAPSESSEILASQLQTRKGHPVHCSLDGELAAVAILAERLRDSTPVALKELERQGFVVETLTGDRTERAKDLDLPNPRGELTPADKQARIDQLRSEGKYPLMVGDGINDASALARAYAGITLASGTDIAHYASSATLYHDDLRVIPWALGLARLADQTIRRNLWMAASYNLVGVALAASGLLHPVVAALLMVGSSLLIIVSASRVDIADDHECQPIKQASSLIWVDETSSKYAAIVHSLAFTLQGLILVSLLGLSDYRGILLPLCFAFIGSLLGLLWKKWPAIPHDLDMSFGMLTLGNLGMVAGWWLDAGFSPLRQGECDCAEALLQGMIKPGMWLGMYLLANLAMIWFLRRPHSPTVSMFVGGNVGMGIGMALGGWLASLYPAGSIPQAGFLSYLGMTIGMIAGMLWGSHLMSRLIGSSQLP